MGRGLVWTVSRRPDQAEARTGPAGLLRPLLLSVDAGGAPAATGDQRVVCELMEEQTQKVAVGGAILAVVGWCRQYPDEVWLKGC